MAIQQSKKQTDLEKRLKTLNFQLYGKQEKSLNKNRSQTSLEVGSLKDTSSSSEMDYLKHDLTKIAIFSTLALGFQFALYFALINNIVKLPI